MIRNKKYPIINRVDSNLFVYLNGKLLRSFLIKENYQKSLQMLKMINLLKKTDNSFIYQSIIFNKISIWSFYQQSIFTALSNYVKYEEIIKFLLENNYKKVLLENNAVEVKPYLEASNIKIINFFNIFLKLKNTLSHYLLKILGGSISFLAFLKLILCRTKFLVYTPDRLTNKDRCDFRFQPIYKYLRENKIKYLEVFHNNFGKDFLKNLFIRRRLVIYLDMFPLFLKKSNYNIENDYDFSVFESYNQRFVINILKHYDKKAKEAIKRIKILNFWLKFSNVKALIALDDVRSANEISFSCRINKIKTFGFQHGQFSKYHVGWMNYNIPKEMSISFDYLYVWNNYWKNVLLKYSSQYSENNIRISGPLKTMKGLNSKKVFSEKEISILLPFETGAPEFEIKNYLHKLIDFNVKIYFKFRPDFPINVQLNKYGISEKSNIELVKSIDENVLKNIDAVAGVCTTMLNEMIFYDKPIFVFKTSMDLGHLLIDDNLAVLLDKDFKLQEIVDYIKNYKSKKEIAWPKTEITLEKTLDKIFKN